jgi:hypothetical protein
MAMTELSTYWPRRYEHNKEIPRAMCIAHDDYHHEHTPKYVNLWKNAIIGSSIRWSFSCETCRIYSSDHDDGMCFDVYLLLWQPQHVTNEQLMAIELLVLELSRWPRV